jgi:hypothetical protein
LIYRSYRNDRNNCSPVANLFERRLLAKQIKLIYDSLSRSKQRITNHRRASMSRAQAEREYKAAYEAWLIASDKDAETFERADKVLKAARATVVQAELAEPTPKEAKRMATILRNANRGLDSGRRFG